MEAVDKDAATRLEVRVRRTARGDGGMSVHHTVYCPKKRRSVSLDTCADCAEGGGLATYEVGGRTYYACQSAPIGLDGHAVRLRFAARGSDGETAISSIMTRDVICLSPEVSVEGATALLLRRGIGGAPVVDDAGRPLGVISKTDLLRESFMEGNTAETERVERPAGTGYLTDYWPGFHVEQPARATVGEIMTPIAFTLPEDASVSQAAALMSEANIHRVPVLDDEGAVVGLVSSLDVLRFLAAEESFVSPPASRA